MTWWLYKRPKSECKVRSPNPTLHGNAMLIIISSKTMFGIITWLYKFEMPVLMILNHIIQNTS